VKNKNAHGIAASLRVLRVMMDRINYTFKGNNITSWAKYN